MRFLNKLGILSSLELASTYEVSSASISLNDFLHHTLSVLEAFPHVLVGGLALAQYADPRMTSDLDFVLSSTDQEGLTKHLESAGYQLMESLPYVKPGRDILKFKYKGREVDFLFFKSADFTSFIAKRAKAVSVLGKTVKVASVEDLVITKLASMRWKDKADIMAIRKKQGDKLDVAYIRERLWDLGILDRIDFLKLPVDD